MFNKTDLKKLQSIRGSTLLEVLISVFIMAFGIMALMLAQLKSVGNVREAEMQTRVAQAVQNLSAGMLSNPDVISNLGTLTATNTKLTYRSYHRSQTITPTANAANIKVCGESHNDNGISNTDLTTCQIQTFTTELQNALPNATKISYVITGTNTDNNDPTTKISVTWTEGNSDNDQFDFNYSAVVGD